MKFLVFGDISEAKKASKIHKLLFFNQHFYCFASLFSWFRLICYVCCLYFVFFFLTVLWFAGDNVDALSLMGEITRQIRERELRQAKEMVHMRQDL